MLWRGHQSMSQEALFLILTTNQLSAHGQLSDHYKMFPELQNGAWQQDYISKVAVPL